VPDDHLATWPRNAKNISRNCRHCASTSFSLVVMLFYSCKSPIVQVVVFVLSGLPAFGRKQPVDMATRPRRDSFLRLLLFLR
jgi:hypothetical protein